MSWQDMVLCRTTTKAAVLLCLSSTLSAAVSDQKNLEDRSSFVQGAVQLRLQKDVDVVDHAGLGLSALEPFTAVHATTIHKLPGAAGPAWGTDETKGFGGVFVNEGEQQGAYGAVGGTNAMDHTSHGIYGGAEIKNAKKKPLFAGAWQGKGQNVQNTVANPSSDGGLDVVSSNSNFGSVPAGAEMEELLKPIMGAAGRLTPASTAGAAPSINHTGAPNQRSPVEKVTLEQIAASPIEQIQDMLRQPAVPGAAVPVAAAPPASKNASAPAASMGSSMGHPDAAQINDILKQPFSADTITMAFRKPGSNHTDLGIGLPQDDILVSGGKYLSTDTVHGSLGGVGGFSYKDQSYHLLYGSGLWMQNSTRLPGGSIGTLSGQPGAMDVTNLQPTGDGGADITSVKLRTQHVNRKELKELLSSGSVSINGTQKIVLPKPMEALTKAPVAANSTQALQNLSLHRIEAPAMSTAAPTKVSSTITSSQAAVATSKASTSTVAVTTTTPATTKAPNTTNASDNAASNDMETAAKPGSLEDAMARISGKMGDVLKDAVPPAVSEAEATDIAEEVAGALEEVLGPLEKVAEDLLEDTTRIKDSALGSLGLPTKSGKSRRHHSQPDPATGADVPLSLNISAIIPEFETDFYRGMMTLAAKWRMFHDIFNNATSFLVNGLTMAGQGHLAGRLQRSFNMTLSSITTFADHVERAMDQIPELDQLAAGQMNTVLQRTNAELYEAYRTLSGLAASRFVGPMEEIMDRVTDAVTSSGFLPERVTKAFGAVEHLATSVQWRLRSAGRELVLGGHEAVAAVAEKAGLPKPSWPPVGVEAVGPDPLGDEEHATPWWLAQQAAQKALHWMHSSASMKAPGALLWLALALVATFS